VDKVDLIAHPFFGSQNQKKRGTGIGETKSINIPTTITRTTISFGRNHGQNSSRVQCRKIRRVLLGNAGLLEFIQ
jgi:hypothetical protein